MPDIIFGHDSNPGGRKYNEDRCSTDAFVTRGGLNLAVAVVCDGVGGEERGERAAQLAIDSFLDFLRNSDIPETPRLLYQAVKTANLSAYNEAQRLDAGERMACTMVVAVIENGATLYISNVGDSRLYLCRDGQLLQMTRDHTFANVMVWLGKLSPEAAAANPDANKVMRVLGTRPDVQPDLGFYLATTDYGDANKIGRQGFKLKTGDSILVCSDGLVKDTATTGQPLVQPKEIAQILQAEEGPKAARAIMGIALGRIPVGEQVDNISVALLQTEDPSRAANAAKIKKIEQEKQRRETTRKMTLIAAAVAIPLCLIVAVTLAALVGVFNFFSSSQAGTATLLAEATAVAMAQTQTVAAFTPTPSPTPTTPPTATPIPTQIPTLAVGEIAKLFRGETLLDTIVDDGRLIAVPGNETQYLAVKHNNQLAEPGNIHLFDNTELTFVSVGDPVFKIEFDSDSDIFVQTGLYPNGAEIRLVGVPVVATVRGCIAAHYYAENFIPFLNLVCFSGECGYTPTRGGAAVPIKVGQQVKININDPGNPEEQAILPADNLKYWKLLDATSAGRADAKRCNVPNVIATQAAQAAIATQQAVAKTAAAIATAECQRLRSLGTPCP